MTTELELWALFSPQTCLMFADLGLHSFLDLQKLRRHLSSRMRIIHWGMLWGISSWRSMFVCPALNTVGYFLSQNLWCNTWINVADSLSLRAVLTSNSAVTQYPIPPRNLWTSESKPTVSTAATLQHYTTDRINRRHNSNRSTRKRFRRPHGSMWCGGR